jgi:hypothetical protein
MRASSLGGRIVGALARDPAVEPPAAGAAELPGWIEHENMAPPRRPLRLPQNSMLGRIAAALARTETVASTAPFTPASREAPAPQEAPTEDAKLTILLAGQRPARRTVKPTRVSGPSHSYEPVEPTSAARLGITTVPA